jgi:hypothetical protein
MRRHSLARPPVSHLAPKRWFAPGRQHTVPAALLLMILLAACQGSGAGPASPSASQTGSPAHTARPAVPALASGCSSSSPCLIAAGTYRLGPQTVLPGLEVTVPSGWSSTENTPGELTLVPPGQPDDTLKFWLDMVAVKSSGTGHGTTILKNVGRTPSALTAWLTHNPDFLIVSMPAPATIGQGITMTSLAVGVSRSANYGDPGCPANPRCADLFTNSYWGSSNFYGIGGDEEVRLYLGTIQISGSPHTFFIALDAVNHADLLRLEKAAKPIVNNVRVPTGTGNG